MRVAVAVAGAVGVAVSAWLLVLVVQHAGEARYVLPAQAIVIGVIGAVAAAAGWSIVAWRREGVILGAVVSAVLVLTGVLALFSIGALLILAAAASAVAVRRAADRRPPDSQPLTPWLPVAIALVALGLPAAALAAADGPSVECLETGVRMSSSLFDPSRSYGSSAHSQGGVVTGTATTGDRTYRFRCEGVRLIEFVTVRS